MDFWQIALLLVAWVICSLLSGLMWALGHRDRRPRQYPSSEWCGSGQKPAPIQSPPPVQVVAPVPQAPLKGMGPDEIRAQIVKDIELWAKTRR